MVVRIRLKRIGRKNRPSYRIVVADSRSPRDGRFIEVIGHYNPMERRLWVSQERVATWLKRGAKPSSTVEHLLRKVGGINS